MDGLELTGNDEPLALFQRWMHEAERTEPNDPNAAALATAGRDGWPTVRMVLMKLADARGFSFFTNTGSTKGRQLCENPRGAMCFHWKSVRRQVRVEGEVLPLEAAEVDAYFHSRSRRSQLGAAVSEQSRVLSSRGALEEAVRRFDERYPGEVPRPSCWQGFCLRPEKIEFWQDGADRLHDRFLFTRMDGVWKMDRLYP